MTDSPAPAASPALNWEPLSPGWLAHGQVYDYLIDRDNLTGRLMLARCRRTAAQPGHEMAMIREIMATAAEMHDPDLAKALAEDFETGRSLHEAAGRGISPAALAAWRRPLRHGDLVSRRPRPWSDADDASRPTWAEPDAIRPTWAGPGTALTLGEMTEPERDAAVRRAVGRFQGELDRTMPLISEAPEDEVTR